MTSSYIIRYGSIADASLIYALKHNKRVLQNERRAKAHIDVAKTPLNYDLHGNKSPQEIENYARSLIALAGIKRLRKNVVIAVEVVFSLPVDQHKHDTKSFFIDCYEWTLKTFDGELLSFDVHLDESAPHAHAIILPLINCKMQGDKLKGNIALIRQRKKAFDDAVASKYGFKNYDLTRLSTADKLGIAREVMLCLRCDSVQNSAIYPWIRDKIYQDPLMVAQMLGIEISPTKQTKAKHFVDIARSNGKGSFVR